MPYVVIVAAVLVISPFVLRIASNQEKKTKKQLKVVFLFVLIAQIILGYLNWKEFGSVNLGLFLVISILQLVMLIMNKYLKIVLLFNFINSILIFLAMIQISSHMGYQVISFPSIATVFLVLFGNVIGLAYINKQKLKLW